MSTAFTGDSTDRPRLPDPTARGLRSSRDDSIPRSGAAGRGRLQADPFGGGLYGADAPCRHLTAVGAQRPGGDGGAAPTRGEGSVSSLARPSAAPPPCCRAPSPEARVGG